MQLNLFSDLYKVILYFFINYRRRFVAVFIFVILLSILELISMSMILPLISLGGNIEANAPLMEKIKYFFNFLNLSFDFYIVLFVFAFVNVIKIFLELFMNIFISNSTVLMARSFRQNIIQGLQNAKWEFFTNKSHGVIINLLSQEIDKAVSLFNVLKTIIIAIFMLIVYFALGTNISIELLFLAILIAFIGYLVAKPMFLMAKKAGVGQVDSLSDLVSDLTDGIRSYKVYKAMAHEKKLMSSLIESNNSFQMANFLKVRAQHFLHASQQFLLIMAVLFGVFLSQKFFKIGFAELGVIIIVLMRINTYSSNLLKKMQAIANSIYVLEKFKNFENELYNSQEIIKGNTFAVFPKKIFLKNISFEINKNKILNNINISIPMQGLTVIMGESGSGKTTLIDLLCGFFKPNKGSILLDDQNLKHIDIRSWRSFIGYASQDTQLLNKSIAENVQLFDKNMKNEEIINCLKLAGIRDVNSKFSQGIFTNVGEGSSRISGGEKQRINIARALSKNPKLLILDEPTSALDKETEINLINTIVHISKKIPVIVISHQLIFKEKANTFVDLNDLS